MFSTLKIFLQVFYRRASNYNSIWTEKNIEAFTEGNFTNVTFKMSTQYARTTTTFFLQFLLQTVILWFHDESLWSGKLGHFFSDWLIAIRKTRRVFAPEMFTSISISTNICQRGNCFRTEKQNKTHKNQVLRNTNTF